MNKFTALIGTVAALAMPFAANAQSFSGNANGSSGYADLEQTLRVTCDVTFDGPVTSSTTVAISSPDITMGDFNCPFVVPQGTWSAATVPGADTKVDITMGATTVSNDPCSGTVRGAWINSTKASTHTKTTLPPTITNATTQPNQTQK